MFLYSHIYSFKTCYDFILLITLYIKCCSVTISMETSLINPLLKWYTCNTMRFLSISSDIWMRIWLCIPSLKIKQKSCILSLKIKQKFCKSYLWLIINFQSKWRICPKKLPCNSFSSVFNMVHKATLVVSLIKEKTAINFILT